MQKKIYLLFIISLIVITCTQKKERSIDGSASLLNRGLSQGEEHKADSESKDANTSRDSNEAKKKPVKNSFDKKNDAFAMEDSNQDGLKIANVNLPSLVEIEKNQPDELSKKEDGTTENEAENSELLENYVSEEIVEEKQEVVKMPVEVTDNILVGKDSTETKKVKSTKTPSLRQDLGEEMAESPGEMREVEKLSGENDKEQTEVQETSEAKGDFSGAEMEPGDIEGGQLLSLQDEEKWVSIRETDTVLNRISNMLKNDK